MKVIIPAAGRGTRLMPFTHFCPKCLIEVNGRPLLHYLLTSLKDLGISEVVIITGHFADKIEEYVAENADFPTVTCVYNKHYETTNSIVSIALSRSFWNEDFCIIDSDLLVDRNLLEMLVSGQNTSLIIDNVKPVEHMDMKVSTEGTRIKYMDKYLLRKDTAGEFFGLSRWTYEDGEEFSKEIDRFLEEEKSNVWYEFVIRELAGRLHLPFNYCPDNSWVEIDSAQDYEKAKLFFPVPKSC